MTDSKEQLVAVVQRVERLEAEKQDIADAIKDVYAEAKANGFDVKALKQVIKLRKMDKEEAEELGHLVSLYKDALGM